MNKINRDIRKLKNLNAPLNTLVRLIIECSSTVWDRNATNDVQTDRKCDAGIQDVSQTDTAKHPS